VDEPNPRFAVRDNSLLSGVLESPAKVLLDESIEKYTVVRQQRPQRGGGISPAASVVRIYNTPQKFELGGNRA
jgi:hypothetical protein